MNDTDIKNFALYFFFNDTATTEIYTLSLHDALPIWKVSFDTSFKEKGLRGSWCGKLNLSLLSPVPLFRAQGRSRIDRKSTRLNSSHANISYAVFCLKKKNNIHTTILFTLFIIRHLHL